MIAKQSVTRRGKVLLAILGLVLAATAATFTNGEFRWRLAVIDMKIRGRLPSFGWGELLWNLRPHSPIYLRSLPALPNPDLAIENPYTTVADSAAGAAEFRRDCSSCHGKDARGGAAGPDLAPGHSPRMRTDWTLYRSIARGIPGTAMRAHDLPPRTVWQLVDYIQSLRSNESVIPAGHALNVPFSKLLNASSDSTGWYTYSGDYQSHRFSRLSMINARNVQRLRVAWQYQSNSNETIFETSPLAIGGVLYFTEPPANVVAIDAADGSLRWRYTRPIPEGVALCCGAVNRGLAVLDSLLYFGTLDAHLVALQTRNGLVAWDRAVSDWHDGYSITGAPLVVKDRVVTGVGGGEFGARGFLVAFEAATGHLLWRFFTVPSPGQPASNTWPGDSWKHGGAPTWLTGSYDPQLNLLYWGVGNPSPNFFGDGRAGDNLYSNSVIAVNPDSGTVRWHFQFTPHDEHDWDAVQVPVLVDAQYQGKRRSLMAWANRNAFYYLLDRETGEFLFARPYAKQNWASGIDSMGRPRALASARPTREGTVVYPGVAGATNWWSPSYSPRTGLLYVPILEDSSMVFSEEPRYERGESYVGSVSQQSTDVQAYVRALDPLTGKLKWEHKFESKNSWHRVGGILSVAGDVVFVGNERTLYALDARTGAELWKFNTGGRISAAPITYVLNGRQYVTIAAGRAVLAFALEEPRGP